MGQSRPEPLTLPSPFLLLSWFPQLLWLALKANTQVHMGRGELCPSSALLAEVRAAGQAPVALPTFLEGMPVWLPTLCLF